MNFTRIALYVSTMMMNGGGLGDEHLLCFSSLFRLMFESDVVFVVMVYGISGAFGCINDVTKRGMDTVCQSKGCIFRHLVVFLGKKIYPVYNFGLYFQSSYHGFRWYWATQIYTAYGAVKVQYG